MVYTLHIGNKKYSSWSMRPWVLMKAFEIPFEENLHEFGSGVRQPTFIAFSPSAKVPCLHDDDIVIWDSLAITEYLAENHSVWPEDRKARAFARCISAEMHSGFSAIRDECSMNVAVRIELGIPSEDLQRDIDRIDSLWTEGLSQFGGPWLAGPKFSAADAFFAPIASRIQTFDINMSATALEYANRLLEHPAVAQWISEGIRETTRCEKHEEWSKGDRKVLRYLS